MRKKTLANARDELVTKTQIESVLTGNLTTHTHSYLPLSGGTLTGQINLTTTTITTPPANTIALAAKSDGLYQKIGTVETKLALTTDLTWANITSKPTTLAVYGITDAVTINTWQDISGRKVFTKSARAIDPSGQPIMINGIGPTSSALGDYAGIGFHNPGVSWANLIYDGSFRLLSSDFSAYQSIHALSFVKSGGTATQFLMADGSSFDKPTTLAGYGITDAYNKTTTDTNFEIRRPTNGVYNNLGSPTVREATLFHGQMNNKFRFIPAQIQEESTDGTVWTTSIRATNDQLKDIMLGEGQVGGITAIPTPAIGGRGYYRLTWDSSQTGYVYLSELYIYNSTNGNNVKFKVEGYQVSNSNWIEVTSGTINNWPGHTYIPHTSVPFSPTANTNGFYRQMRITFSIESATYTNPFTIYSIEWFGGYPAGRRNVESYDRNKNVTFPASVNATSFIANGNTVYHTGNLAPVTLNTEQYITANKTFTGGINGFVKQASKTNPIEQPVFINGTGGATLGESAAIGFHNPGRNYSSIVYHDGLFKFMNSVMGGYNGIIASTGNFTDLTANYIPKHSRYACAIC